MLAAPVPTALGGQGLMWHYVVMKLLGSALALLSIVLQIPLAGGIDIKSVQVWSQSTVAADGALEWSLPTSVYISSLEAAGSDLDASSLVSARQAINQWTFVGCYIGKEEAVFPMVSSANNPLACTFLCEAQEMKTAAVQGTDCFCADSRALLTKDNMELCDRPCPDDYYNGTARQCGGFLGHYSVYQKYDMVHQTAQGCYDPKRFIWYQNVAIESMKTEIVQGQTVETSTVEWYLHASSITSGDPLFPYHQPQNYLTVGLQYDIINSRIVGLEVQTWDNKVPDDNFEASVQMYRVRSLQEHLITFTRTEVTFPYEDSSAADFFFNTGVSALDSINNLYFITLPFLPTVPGKGLAVTGYKTRIYGINLDVSAGSRVLLNKEVDHKIVLLEANSRYHDLFALVHESADSQPNSELRYFYYVKLGHSSRNEFTNLVEFTWTFTKPQASVVNPYSFTQYLDKYYQVGATGVDHLSNTSFLVYKDLPDADQPWQVADINQRGFLNQINFEPLPSPAVQATWLVNTDPQIPLTLPSPKLLYARYSIDGRSIIVQFDSFTVEGALPVDTDGDFIPDDIDWSAKQEGMRNCSDMFSRATAEKLGNLPETRCLWRSGTTIQIMVQKGFDAIKVGDALFLKDQTIFAYVQERNEWSYAASGGITVSLPEPLEAPVITASYARLVDLCSSVSINADKSRNHGGMPRWTWKLFSVQCVGREASTTFKRLVEMKLKEVSVDGEKEYGMDSISFGQDDLEPGCEYVISVTLAGRWKLSTTEQLKIFKKRIPAPQVTLSQGAKIYTMRSKTVTILTNVEQSECESIVQQAQTLKYEWTAVQKQSNALTGAVETRVLDLSMLGIKTGSASILIPKRSLLPDTVYTMTVSVGYEQTWSDADSKTSAIVEVEVTRSPIKVNVVGGSRKVLKSNPAAIDATTSLDPDFPDQLIEDQTDWVFSYKCTTLSGDPCFPLEAEGVDLPEVKNCRMTGETFKDLGKTYDLPTFSSLRLASDAFYCRDATRNGVLLLNSPNPAMMPGNYTFVIQADAHGRVATATVTLEIEPEQLPGPEVLIQPIEEPKVDVTKSFRVIGNVVEEDLAEFGDTVAWSWAFFREEANPRWSQQQKDRVQDEGQPYLVPEKIFVIADEINPSDPSLFRSLPTSNNLVVRANVMLPSSTYSFRLTALAPNPFGGEPLVGYADATVKTAGAPPQGGQLEIEPPDESVVDVPKTMRALNWVAEDVPLAYMFSYRTDLQDEFSTKIDLRIKAITAPSQSVRCFKAGEAADNYMIEVNVTVSSLYGATTTIPRYYKSLPPADPAATNLKILAMAGSLDPEAQAQLLNCISLVSEPPPSSDPGLGVDVEIPVVPVTQAPAPATIPPTDGESPSPPPTTTQATTTTTTTTFRAPTQEEQDQAEAMIDILDRSSTVAPVTSESVASNLKIVNNVASKGIVTQNMVGFVEKMGDAVADLAEAGEGDEAINDMAGAVFNALGAMGKTSTTAAQATAAQARSANMNAVSSGAFFPSSSSVAASAYVRGPGSSFGGVRSAERRLAPNVQDTYTKLSSGPRRLGGALDEQKVGIPPYIVRPGAYPDWNALPPKFQDPQYASRRRGFYARSVDSDPSKMLAEMYDQQEALELEWSSYINSTASQDDFIKAQAALDDEYFANYSAHLGTGERESVVREWWEERARMESLEASRNYQQAQLTRKTMTTIQKISSTLVKFMVNGEIPKDFNFPMGLIRIGKTRDLQNADQSFHFQDSKWKLNADSPGAYGFGHTKYTTVNPMAWSAGAPIGPFLVSALEVFSEDGTVIPVTRESQPLSIMSDHSSFASASCFYWDWEARDGLGGWSEEGLLNSENGCSSTHLSLIGMFLDSIAPDDGIEILSAVDTAMDRLITKYNELVVVGLGAVIVLILLLHYWGTKQDESDRTKPMEMKKLGDGIRGPRSQDDPVDYSASGSLRACRTFWNLLTRDHILVACFCRCPKMKTTRLQKVSALFAMLAGNSAVAALFFGEHVVDPKHFMEVGIIAAVITYPMVRVILLMFSLRPAREMPRPEQSIFSTAKPSEAGFVGPLEAVPVPEDEQEDEEDVYGDPGTLALPPIAGPLAAADRGQAHVSLPAVRSHSPALAAPPAGRALISAPEEGGGPQAGLHPQPAAVEQVLSGIMPPAPPQRPPPPPPPMRGQPLASDTAEGSEQQSQPSPSHPPPLPPPAVAPPPLVSSSTRDLAAARAALGGSTQDELASARSALGGSPQDDMAAARSALGGSPQDGMAAARAAMGGPSSSQEGLTSARAAMGASSSGLPSPAPEAAEAAAGSPLVSPERPAGMSALALPAPADPGAAPFGPTPQLPGEGDDQLALAPPPMPPPDSGASELQSQTQAQLLRRVRKVYIEKVIRNSERLAYDERVDMKSSVPHPMAQVANALAYTAVVCFWATALVLTGVYSVHLNSKDALRWLYSCLIGWGFTWFVLELVKALLVTILELQQLNQRRRIKDHRSLRDQVAMKKAMKMKRMEELAHLSGEIVPGGSAQIERSPIEILQLPPPPVPPERGELLDTPNSRGEQPDASAGF